MRLSRWFWTSNGLYHQGGGTGEFAHSEMGRAAVDGNLGVYQTVYALYGLTAFADRGHVVDPPLASLAFERCQEAARFLNDVDPSGDPIPRSVIYTRLARCSERYGLPVSMIAGLLILLWRRGWDSKRKNRARDKGYSGINNHRSHNVTSVRNVVRDLV